MLTGTFTHGTYPQISSILASYAAEITSEVREADCVLVGDIPENFKSYIVSKAKVTGVPVMYERQFFHMYDIDSDLANLK